MTVLPGEKQLRIQSKYPILFRRQALLQGIHVRLSRLTPFGLMQIGYSADSSGRAYRTN